MPNINIQAQYVITLDLANFGATSTSIVLGGYGAGGGGGVGATGPAGADGVDGRTVLNGIGVPDPGLGLDGDFYIDTAADTIYGPKTAGVWGAATSLVGPTGAAGADGATGATGATGAAGADGATGVDGKTVLNGAVAPTTEGVDGDFYIDTAAWDIYGPKAAGVWGSGTTLIGPGGSGSVTSGAGVPASTPTAIGDRYIDLTAGSSYFAKGTASAADWVLVLNDGSGTTLADKATPVAADGILGFDSENADEVVVLPGQAYRHVCFVVACSDETTNLVVAAGVRKFRAPYAFVITEVRADLNTALTGAIGQFDINEAGVSILSTPLTIDDGETSSLTAATPAVISDPNVADGAELSFDIDVIGATIAGNGLKISLIGYRP